MAFVHGTAPWLATRLIRQGDDLAAPGYSVMLMAVVSLIAVLGVGIRVGAALA